MFLLWGVCLCSETITMMSKHGGFGLALPVGGLTDGQGLEGLRVAELALTLPVDGCDSHLVRGVGLQPRQHHGGWGEEHRSHQH